MHVLHAPCCGVLREVHVSCIGTPRSTDYTVCHFLVAQDARFPFFSSFPSSLPSSITLASLVKPRHSNSNNNNNNDDDVESHSDLASPDAFREREEEGGGGAENLRSQVTPGMA